MFCVRNNHDVGGAHVRGARAQPDLHAQARHRAKVRAHPARDDPARQEGDCDRGLPGRDQLHHGVHAQEAHRHGSRRGRQKKISGISVIRILWLKFLPYLWISGRTYLTYLHGDSQKKNYSLFHEILNEVL